MRNFLVIFLILALTFSGCSETVFEESTNISENVDNLNNENPRQKVYVNGAHHLLGWGYDATNSFLDFSKYILLPVINVDRLKQELPDDFFTGFPNDNLSIIYAGSNAKNFFL